MEQEHRALVACLDAATEHSGQTILEMGSRLGDVMTQGLQLRTLMQEVGSSVGTDDAAELATALGHHGRRFRELAAATDDAEFGAACLRLAETLARESALLARDDKRRQAEVITLTSELGALTGSLLAQAGQAISALQFQDPAIQELRRIDSLVLELRQAIDSDAAAVKWGHRIGDSRKMTGTSPIDLASRALAIKQDTARRVQTFESQTQEAVAEIRRIHASLRAVTHAQVAKSAQTAQTLDPSGLRLLQKCCTSLGVAMSRLEDLIETGQQLTGNLTRMLELSETAIGEGHDRRSTIAVVSGEFSAATSQADPQPRLIVESRDELRRTQEVLEALLAHDRKIRNFASRVEAQLHATRASFTAFAEPLSARESDPVPKLLKDASHAAARMFDIIVEEFGLDAASIVPDASWDEGGTEQAEDAGLILL